jgi:hypothetical protein
MPLATAVTSTDVEETIETELISDYFAGFEYPDRVGELVATKVMSQGTVPVRFPRLNEFDLSGIGTSHTETVDAVDVQADTTESSITPALQIARLPISDESDINSKGRFKLKMLEDFVIAMSNRMDASILAASTSATLQTGAVADSLTLDRLRTALTYASTQDIPAASYDVVLSQSAAGALWQSIGTTSANFAVGPSDLQSMGNRGGFMGSLYGHRIFKSSNVAAESTGWSNFLVPSGMSSLGLALVESPNVRMTRGDDAESRAVTYFVVRAWWGAGIINPRQFVELLSA